MRQRELWFAPKVLLEHKEHTFALRVAGFVLAVEHGSQQVPEELPSVDRVSDMLF